MEQAFKEPLVSVIMPVYNRAGLIAESLESVVNQIYGNWELIVVDDGSKDSTQDIVAGYAQRDSRISLFKRINGKKGPSRCRNIGINNCHGEFVVFLDSDDLLVPCCLERRVRQFALSPENDFWVFPMGIFHEHIGDNSEAANQPSSLGDLERFIGFNFPWTVTSPLWRRSFLKKIGGFNEKYTHFEDPELHIRALLHKNVRYDVCRERGFDCYWRLPKDYRHKGKKALDSNIKALINFIIDVRSIVNSQGFEKNYVDNLESRLRGPLFTTISQILEGKISWSERKRLYDILLKDCLDIGIIQSKHIILFQIYYICFYFRLTKFRTFRRCFVNKIIER